MNSRCPACGHDHCEDIIGLADRLAALEARLPVVAKCEPWCGSSTSPGTGREFQCDINRQSRYFCTDACRFMERPLAPAASEPTPPPGAEPPCFMSDRRMRYLPGWVAPLDHEGKSRVVLERGPIRAAGGGMAFYCRTPSGALVSVHVEEDGIGATHEGPDGKKFGGIDWECVAVYGTTPPPGNLGIPEGFKLGDGWGVAAPYWKCHAHRMIHAANATRTMAPSKGYSVCWDEATRNGALVPVEPPAKAEPDCPQCDGGVCVGLSPVKAEATQAAEPPKCHVCHEDDATCLYPTSDGRHWCKCCRCKRCGNSPPNGSTCLCDYRPVEQAAEPSAPAGYSREYIVACSEEAFGAPTVRGKPAAPPVAACLYPDKCGKRWLRKGVLYDGDDGSPPWQCPNCKAPPVTAKLSERTDAAQQAIYHAAMARVAELETALNAAKRSLQQSREAYSIVDAERNAAKAEAKKCGDEWDLLCGAMCTECADHVVTKGQLATRDARIAGLEASAAEDSKARAALEARCAAAEHDAGVLRDRFVGMSGWGRQ